MGAEKLATHLETTPNVVGGRPRISGRRITVQNIVVWYERMGLGLNEIASEHGLTLAEVHAALAYYFDHREEIDLQIEEDGEFARALANSGHSPLAAKLRQQADPGED